MKRSFLTTTCLTATGLALGGTLIANGAAAQQTYDLGTLVLSSSLTPVELGRTGATVEVLEGGEVGRNDTRVLDRLDRLPGVSSSSTGGLGAGSTLRIRGLSARYVGVRLNGMDISDPSNGGQEFNFGGLTSSGIQRIEVLKGSQSALYGSQAIAGVINMTTFTPEKLGYSGEANVEAGTYDTYSGSLSAGYKTERGYVALSYGRIETDGFSAQSFNTEKDGFRQTTVDMTGEYAVTDSLTVGTALHYRDGKVEIDRFNDPTGENYIEEWGARVFSTLEAGALTHTVSYTYFDIDRDDPGGFTRKFTGERQTFDYLGTAELGAATTLSFGAEHVTEKFTNDADRGSEDNTAIKAELLVSPTDRIDLSAALRYDDNSDFGGKTTGRLAAVWRPVEDVAFRAVVGTGYRAPSLYERFSLYGLPSLQPENSTSYELGVEKTFGTAGYVKATVFYTTIDDLIDFDFFNNGCNNGNQGCYLQVLGETTSKGIELSGEFALTTGLSVFGAYTYNDAETDGQRLQRTPKHDLVVGLSNDFTDKLSAYVDVRHVADIIPSPFAPVGHKVGDYTLVGAGMSYDVTEKAELYLRIENLFDEDYETAGGYNQPGRAAYVGLRATF
ncbi:TonB-dependent receptor [Pelagivirga sediminicola]|uniref:TonB-dependent receptor n=1 Tax=Pelagivirga sediminicola TaxID=2170575 RepID=A0A2T7GBC3_9RHOB|nr:TonB-dependent receptor [Pelagivirga sediminicola]PVA11730.1 TonB-dependent receptor [Pelagivirga sediminicola]